MDKLFPFKKRFIHTYPNAVVRKSATLDWTVKGACENCNITWMSNIEQDHAMPVMTPLILGDAGITITQLQADSISLFAFKTAVILSCINRNRQSFFPRSVRYGFRTSRGIPVSTRMWLAGFGTLEQGNVKTSYHEGNLSTKTRHPVQFYVCTFSAGHLVFQVVSIKTFLGPRIDLIPADGKYLAVPFWPNIPSSVVWPLSHVLRNPTEFNAFADRWQKVFVRRVSE